MTKIVNSDRFFRVYDNIPINTRKELIVIIDDKPITWDIAYKEIKNESSLGYKIFNKLVKLKFI